jgi:hypothetical protein
MALGAYAEQVCIKIYLAHVRDKTGTNSLINVLYGLVGRCM